jgi:23S rRNA pseudouridine2605 synthase
MTDTPAGDRRRGEVSLCRAFAKRGLGSRSQAEKWIRAGRVEVDGVVERNPARPVVPEAVVLALDGSTLLSPPDLTLMLHKPRGVVTTRHDPEGRPTVFSCLVGVEQHLGPVGRLDADSTGLLLLTNDSRLADWLTDPRNEVRRRYRVVVRGSLTEAERDQVVAGVEHRGEQLRAAAVRFEKRSARATRLEVDLEEGKNREVRRLFAAVGHPVRSLERVGLGGLELGTLLSGEFREVSPAELRAAFPGAPIRALSAGPHRLRGRT